VFYDKLDAVKTRAEWIRQYSESHQHPINRICHTVGIPMIVASLPLALLVLFKRELWPIPALLFVMGWIFQFTGHAFERKLPEFFKDWRFLFVGLSWWLAKIRGRV
jgi:uncharacterized membrane protein YGL010W